MRLKCSKNDNIEPHQSFVVLLKESVNMLSVKIMMLIPTIIMIIIIVIIIIMIIAAGKEKVQVVAIIVI